MRSAERLIYRDQVDAEFAAKVIEVAGYLGIDPDWLMAVIAFESAKTFSPSVQNPRSSATGLIQFMPRTAERMGTTTRALSRMTATEQLDWVELYFKPWRGQLDSLEDVYMAVLWPRAIGKPLDYVLFAEEDGNAYRWNVGLDLNNDGSVTKQEAAARVRRLYETGRRRREAHA